MYGQRGIAEMLNICRDIREFAAKDALLLNYAKGYQGRSPPESEVGRRIAGGSRGANKNAGESDKGKDRAKVV